MASGVAAESILFIGAIIAATALAGVITGVTQVVSNDVREQGEQRADALSSDIAILNDPAAVEVIPELVLYVKNTGIVTLNAPDTSILVDGVYVTAPTFDVLGSTDDETWPPGAVVQITMTTSLGGGDHRAKVTTGTGATALFAWSD